ncbi:glutaminyl-peptide cyclotransferase [Robiginitalea sp. IMCC44478]|uniref:glutaminyl-peptide cyclotransferase n=1 Tax=Robiginitalea sp. IMCC44478 TaxID=3459122 RepID=UPI004042CC99
MSFWKISSSLLFLLLFLACGDEDPSRQFAIKFDTSGKSFQDGESPGISIRNSSGKEIDSVAYFLDQVPLKVDQGRISLTAQTLGEKTLSAKIFCEGETIEISREITLLAGKAPELYTYSIINTYPHDRKAFTQGLEFYQDTLYESTGQNGASSLRKVDFKTGEILQQADLERQYFGEGITILGDRILMLTWKSKTGFIYNRKTLDRLGSFAYGESKEGWGLCHDGTRIYKSDGSQKIWILDPQTYSETGHIETVTNTSVFNKANELEYVDGKIYANVWQRESMMIIDAASGAIEGVVNFAGLKNKVTQHPELDVLNGVAYHPERKTFFVTGKRWDKLFEVRIEKKD